MLGQWQLVACRLVPLDKCPGVRPIGIVEVLRRIVGKAAMSAVSGDVKAAAGSVQLCAGQDAGVEAAVHAMRSVFEDERTEAVLLVDASNAFNSINRKAALHNVKVLCPVIATILENVYQAPAKLYLLGGTVLESQEGTTQGDPLAMAFYAMAVMPLIAYLDATCPATQTWFADDAAVGERVTRLASWWQNLITYGPKFGYHPNAAKTWIVAKPEHYQKAADAFLETGVQVTAEGQRYLGGALGSQAFINQYVQRKVTAWVNKIDRLSKIAKTQPHAAFAAFTHGLVNEWTYLQRVVPGTADLFSPLEEALHQRFLPALLGRLPSGPDERALLSLPPAAGGLGVINPALSAEKVFTDSQRITAPLVALVLQHDALYGAETVSSTKVAKSSVRQDSRAAVQARRRLIYNGASPSVQRSMDHASEKGASSWLTALPIEELGMHLHKGDFRDAVYLRYNWELPNTPQTCACGSPFSVSHALSCPKGGFIIARHNSLRNMTGKLLSEVCRDVQIEPPLQRLDGESFHLRSTIVSEEARLDVRARSFWRDGQDAFFDVRVFNPHASSHRDSSLRLLYAKQEREKQRAYQQRVTDVERGSFTPLVFASTGGMGPQATVFFKRLAAQLAIKRGEEYSDVMSWLRCRLCFSLLRSAIQCVRGSRVIFPSVEAVQSFEAAALQMC